MPEAAAGERAPFAAPTPGSTPQMRWLQKCSLAAEHAAAGDFASAMRLLERWDPACCTATVQCCTAFAGGPA